eukprot:424052-Alexandrium_andersonii.AAC.1
MSNAGQVHIASCGHQARWGLMAHQQGGNVQVEAHASRSAQRIMCLSIGDIFPDTSQRKSCCKPNSLLAVWPRWLYCSKRAQDSLVHGVT